MFPLNRESRIVGGGRALEGGEFDRGCAGPGALIAGPSCNLAGQEVVKGLSVNIIDSLILTVEVGYGEI